MPDPQDAKEQANPETNKSNENDKEEQAKKKKEKSEDPVPYKKDWEGNELIGWEKTISGSVLVLLTFLSGFLIVWFWPDRLPKPDEKIAPLYINEGFHVRLACLKDTCCPECVYDLDIPAATTTTSTASTGSDRSTATSSATATSQVITNTQASTNIAAPTASPATTLSAPATTIVTGSDTTPQDESKQKKRIYKRDELLHINTLLLILVGLGGFLGNMIHIATSFTTFVGAGKFKKSWLLWYCIKPFTASALAIGIYFVFRGGFLNMSDGGSSINLYGLMTISLFAGLFTDRATEKLKEVFEVLFRSKEDRPDPLVSKFKILNISPLIIEKNKVNKMTLTGEKLDTEKLKVSINNEEITDIKTSAGTITFDYTIPDTQKDKKTLTVSVKDDKGKEHYTVDLTVKEPEPPADDLKPDETKPPVKPLQEDKPADEKKESETEAPALTEKTEIKSDPEKPDPSASNDDDDDADEPGATGESTIKG